MSIERCVVLVVDDEPAVLRLLALALTRHGYIVITAPDGPTALRFSLTREGPIHLAVLDVIMPGMSGPELFARLRESRPKIEVLFMSGYDARDVPPAGHFIGKPFYPRDVVERVNAALGNKGICAPVEDKPEPHQGESCGARTGPAVSDSSGKRPPSATSPGLHDL